jgi:hypothetical protein
MSESEELEYKRAALQILRSILGELVPDFWKTLIDQWEQEGRPGPSPLDRQYPLDELSKMATEWLLTVTGMSSPSSGRVTRLRYSLS